MNYIYIIRVNKYQGYVYVVLADSEENALKTVTRGGVFNFERNEMRITRTIEVKENSYKIDEVHSHTKFGIIIYEHECYDGYGY